MRPSVLSWGALARRDDAVPANDPRRMLILGAVVCIDRVLKG